MPVAGVVVAVPRQPSFLRAEPVAKISLEPLILILRLRRCDGQGKPVSKPRSARTSSKAVLYGLQNFYAFMIMSVRPGLLVSLHQPLTVAQADLHDVQWLGHDCRVRRHLHRIPAVRRLDSGDQGDGVSLRRTSRSEGMDTEYNVPANRAEPSLRLGWIHCIAAVYYTDRDVGRGDLPPTDDGSNKGRGGKAHARTNLYTGREDEGQRGMERRGAQGRVPWCYHGNERAACSVYSVIMCYILLASLRSWWLSSLPAFFFSPSRPIPSRPSMIFSSPKCALCSNSGASP